MKRLLCLLTAHQYGPWRLVVAYFGREIAKDACVRDCRCGARQSQIIPFRRFNLTK